ncbi:methionine synthase [Athalassotoga saccharophila]|uniref:methionine synthase n=1 Tax=Athalassotoga saccharophila TaxID=1441386 RepID=UPI00137A2E3D|nr:methionine synthase [Athalassotoga saccharophila]BBJ28686.1 vitamin B12 dependent methionine synthase [Athalassotoga saccharophila]
MKVIEIPPQDIDIPQRAIAARMGFRGLGEVPDQFKPIYEELISLLLKVSNPRVAFDDFVPSIENGEISIGNVKIIGTLAKSQLGKSVEITAMLVTLGDKIDEEIAHFHDVGDDLRSFMLDSIGSEFVEYVARKFDASLRSKKSLKGSARIAPGYVDLPITLNKWFASEFGKAISVTIDPDSFVFLPRKTISAFIGWSN